MRKIARDDCPCNPEGWMSATLLVVLLAALRLYRATPRPVRCRRPGMSCSRYMTHALRAHGPIRGLGEGLIYLASCRAATSASRAVSVPRPNPGWCG